MIKTLAKRRRRNLWELAILVLGTNLWVTFLLVPLLHLKPEDRGLALPLVGLPLLVLLAGVLLRKRELLLGLYPLCLCLPVLFTPKLAGINVYSMLTFCLVAVSFVAYLVATAALLEAIVGPDRPTETKELGPVKLDERWRRRLRIHRWMALLAALFPACFIFTVFLHPGVQQDLAAYYPRRGAAAHGFIGVLALALWLAVFYAHFMLPLKAHVKGDPALQYELRRLRREARLGRPRPGFYAFVALALISMVLLVLGKGC